jgi:hypothetical protein
MMKHKDLATDIIMLKRGGVKAVNPNTLPHCDFHCHGKEEPCPVKKGKSS